MKKIITKILNIIIKCILGIIILLLLLTIWYEVPVTEHITIDGNGKIKEPVRFALVTDLHSCYYGKDQSQLIKMIEKENVDAVLLSGDIFDDRLDPENSRIFTREIAAMYPCFYATGNHELWSVKTMEFKEYLASVGVTVLDGDAATINIKGNYIDICGVDDPTYMTMEEWTAQLDEAIDGASPENYKVLISHRPERNDIYSQYDFDLVVCGHAHGGQWRIPFTQMGVVAPDQGFFPKFVDGTYDLGNGHSMVVSRGLARERMPYPRFFNHPEIVIIDIQ